MTECSKCGECCTAISLNTSKANLRRVLAAFPDDPEHEENRQNARFILTHWHGGRRDSAIEGDDKGHYRTHRWSCDRFDPETRLCMAHDQRPPICRGFPWYGEDPVKRTMGLPTVCTFWADVPEDHQPQEVKVEIRKRSELATLTPVS